MHKYTDTDLLCIRKELQQVFEQLRPINLSFSPSYVFNNGAVGPASQTIHFNSAQWYIAQVLSFNAGSSVSTNTKIPVESDVADCLRFKSRWNETKALTLKLGTIYSKYTHIIVDLNCLERFESSAQLQVTSLLSVYRLLKFTSKCQHVQFFKLAHRWRFQWYRQICRTATQHLITPLLLKNNNNKTLLENHHYQWKIREADTSTQYNML